MSDQYERAAMERERLMAQRAVVDEYARAALKRDEAEFEEPQAPRLRPITRRLMNRRAARGLAR